MLVHRYSLGLALAACLACCVTLRAADDADQKDKPKAEQKDKAKADKDDANGDSKEDAKEEAQDAYQVPEGGVKELLAFIKQTQAVRPKSREEMVQLQLKGRPAMKAAAEKIQKIATDEDKKLEGYDEAMAFLLLMRAAESRNASLDDIKKLVEDIKENLAAHDNPSLQAISAARQIGITLEYDSRPERREYAAVAYGELAAALAKSKSEDAHKIAVKMEGAVRRLDLLGNTVAISGTEMDGAKFDWAKYRGKVVLVDFWATWCGPCLAELPNVKKNYEAYHERGFEVVGISLDQDRAKLEKFIEKEQNPWLTLHDGAWDDNPVANYYGIVGIPTVILVDKEGKVVSTNARGPELGKLLTELLGPAKPGDTEKPAGTEKPTGTDKPADAAAK